MPHYLYLAPLRGLTDHIFRKVYSQHFHGYDLAISPFIAAVGRGRKKNSSLADLAPEHNKRLPVIPQILTKEPEEFIDLAERLAEAGHETVNWNLGCPYPMVIRKGKGAALLPHPEIIDSFLKEVIPRTGAKVSVKMRLGLESPDEILQVIPVLNSHPLKEVIIHARTAAQMYKGTPYRDRFEECLSLLNHPVVYNGDITSAAVFEELSLRFPKVDRWMIGRGAAMDPFLAEKIKGIETGADSDMMERVYNFHKGMFHEYQKTLSGHAHLLDKMKNLWSYMGEAFVDGHKVMKKIKKTGSEDNYQKVVAEVFHSGVLKAEKE